MATEAHGEAGKAVGMPQLDFSTWPNQIFWLLVTLVVIYFVLSKIALPRIGADLGAGAAGLRWAVNGYTLSLASLILLGGSLSDMFGRRRIFVVGVGWFAGASLLCGLAPASRR